MYKVTITLGVGVPTPQGILRASIEHERVKSVTYESDWIILDVEGGVETRYARSGVLTVQTDPHGSIIK